VRSAGSTPPVRTGLPAVDPGVEVTPSLHVHLVCHVTPG
jgi:hypothetical protein